MPTVTVRLDKPRAARPARWAGRAELPKSDVIRAPVDRAGPIDAGSGVIEWVKSGPARAFLPVPRGRPLLASMVTVANILEDVAALIAAPSSDSAIGP